MAKVLAGRAKDIRFLDAVFHAGLVDPEMVARKLTTVALRSSETEMLRHAQRLLDGVPRGASYAERPCGCGRRHCEAPRQARENARRVRTLRPHEQ